MSTISDVPAGCKIHADGYELEYDDDGARSAIRFIVPGADRADFVEAVGGLPETVAYPGGVTATRVVPLLHPVVPNCYATGFRLYRAPNSRVTAPTGTGPSDPLSIEYDWYYADVRFSTPRWSDSGDYPLVEESLDGGMEMVTRPGTAYVFPSDSLPVGHPVGVPVSTMDFALTFHRVPSLDQALFASLTGCVNSTSFYGCDAGKVHYVGPSTQGRTTVGGVTSWTISHRFRYRSVEHNKIMRPDGSAFEAPLAGGQTMLPAADLNLLFY